MLSQYGLIGLLLIVAIIFPSGALVTSYLFGRLGLRPDNPELTKADTYECGVETVGTSWVQFNFRYYFYALLFVIFDIEAVFLFPWAVYFKQLKLFGLVEMLVFILILLVGYFYAWKKRALEWT